MSEGVLLTDEDRALLVKVSGLLEEIVETFSILEDKEAMSCLKKAEADVKAGRVKRLRCVPQGAEANWRNIKESLRITQTANLSELVFLCKYLSSLATFFRLNLHRPLSSIALHPKCL